MFIFHEDFIESTLFSENKISAGFATRRVGDGRNQNIIKSFLTKENIPYDYIIDPQQVHGDHIEIITSQNNTSSEIPNTDGLITSEKGLLLTIVTADCVPIIFVDGVKNIVGISHQGWRGTEIHLAQKMVAELEKLGCKKEDLRIAIGPAINECHYRRNILKENFDQLVESGVYKDQIDFFPYCTYCDSDRFYSYRRDKKTDFEEQFSFVVLN